MKPDKQAELIKAIARIIEPLQFDSTKPSAEAYRKARAIIPVIRAAMEPDVRMIGDAVRVIIRQAEQIAATEARAQGLVEALGNLLTASERHIFGDECLAERETARQALAAWKEPKQ